MEHKIITNLPQNLNEMLERFVNKNGATRASVAKIALEKYLSEIEKNDA